jgi:hypothetical protein
VRPGIIPLGRLPVGGRIVGDIITTVVGRLAAGVAVVRAAEHAPTRARSAVPNTSTTLG